MDEEIAQFVSITGLDSDKAKFYVESARGDVETALSTFYETEGVAEGSEGQEGQEKDESGVQAAQASVPDASYSGPRTLSGAPAPPSASASGFAASSSSSAKKSGRGFNASNSRGNIATFNDLQGNSDDGGRGDADDDDDEDDSKDPLNFFTGGERSGLNVQNPNHRRGDKAPEVVQNILKRAAEAGQRESERGGNPARPAQGSSSQSASSFAGRGRTINDEAAAAATTTPEAAPAPPTLTSEGLRALRNAPFGGRGFGGMMGEEEDGDDDEEDEIAIRRITFWQDGFSIEDGPLCRYDDPQHADTLALINSNRAPLHLLNVKFGQRVELHVEKKTQEKYTPPPPRPMKAFEGSGNRLGAPVATMTGAGSSATDSTAVPAAPAVPPQSTSFEVDASQPTTQIQIRLGNGQRMVAKFNHTHTVADIRRYINASDPAMGQRDYTLQSSFPPKPLSDETQSLKDANLINSVVIQKWS